MEKKMIQKEVFKTTHKSKPIRLTYELIEELKAGDIIFADYAEESWPEDEDYGGHFYFKIIREVEETDEEFENRKMALESQEKYMKQRRYEQYLELKKEFGDDA